MSKGLDISIYQGTVDFKQVKDNADFVIIRATHGNGYKDANFEKNRDEARAVDLGIGFYHFAYPQYNSPEDEASWFSKVVSCQPGEILCLDFEEASPTPVDWCKRFLDKVASNMGFKPLIYLNLSTVQSFDWTPIINAGYGLWLAHYDNNESADVTKWPLVAMKQYTNTGTMQGVSGDVDLDIFYGTMGQFKEYGNPIPAPISDPVPTSEPTPSIPGPVPTPIPPVEVPPVDPVPVTTVTRPDWLNRFIKWLDTFFSKS